MRTAFVAIALFAGLASASAQDHSGHGATHGGAPSQASNEYMDAMRRMDESMRGMSMTGRPGVDFAEMMIPHHQAAIDMAKSYLASNEGDAELVKLSNEIIAAQEREIAGLKDWLARNK